MRVATGTDEKGLSKNGWTEEKGLSKKWYDMHVSLSGVASTFGTVTLLVAYLANGLKRVCTRHYSVWHEGNRCFLDTTACQHDLFDFA